MAYITLQQWDAVEVFCRILVRYEKNRTLEQFLNNEFLKEKLQEYSEGETYLIVSSKIFKVKTNDKKKVVPKKPKAFYELCRLIKNTIPVVLPWDVYSGFMKYIKLSPDTFPYKISVEWQPSKVQRKLEGKNWIIYYMHRDGIGGEEPDDPSIHRDGIATAILELKPFAKAEIRGFKPDECYEGKFETYGKDEKFIRLNMRLKEHHTKDLSMLIYLGNGSVELALGQYHNLGRSIYSGTVMIEPLLTSTEKEIEAQFYTGSKIKTLPKHVQDYFEDKPKNMLRVPCKVTSKLDFKKWHIGKKGGDANK